MPEFKSVLYTEKNLFPYLNLNLVGTPHGSVVAFETEGLDIRRTTVAGIYRQDELDWKMDLTTGRSFLGKMPQGLEYIPEDEKVRGDISEVLRKEGYRGPIAFWRPFQ